VSLPTTVMTAFSMPDSFIDAGETAQVRRSVSAVSV
jgi:hypothetical protein